MNQRTRMWKTLGCLVASMSGTAALLGWMAPATTSYPIPIHPDDIVRLARGEVAENVAILDEKWFEVEVATAPDGILGSAMLAATGHSTDWHFSVDRNGFPSRGDAWGDQRAATHNPGSVRIVVLELEDGGTMSKAQWFCVQALVTAINDALGLEQTSLPISLQQGLARTYGIPSGGHIEFSSSLTAAH